MSNITSYFDDNIFDSHNLEYTFGDTDKNLVDWLKEVGVGSMTDVTMQTIFDTIDVTPEEVIDAIEDIRELYERILNRPLTENEYETMVDVIYFHCEA